MWMLLSVQNMICLLNILDMLINKTVEIDIKEGIIKSKSIIVDATHTSVRYNQKLP